MVGWWDGGGRRESGEEEGQTPEGRGEGGRRSQGMQIVGTNSSAVCLACDVL